MHPFKNHQFKVKDEKEVRLEEENKQSSRWWNVRCSVGV